LISFRHLRVVVVASMSCIAEAANPTAVTGSISKLASFIYSQKKKFVTDQANYISERSAKSGGLYVLVFVRVAQRCLCL